MGILQKYWRLVYFFFAFAGERDRERERERERFAICIINHDTL
jgi:hypothetical protein